MEHFHRRLWLPKRWLKAATDPRELLSQFLAKNEEFLDLENRAYYLTIFNQRWLGFRLDFFGAFLT